MTEQAWRPRRCGYAHSRSGSPWVPVRPYYEGLPPSGGQHGPDEGRRKPPGSRGMKVLRFGPDEPVPGWKTPQWSAGRRRARKARGTARCQLSKRLSALRSLTPVREGKRGRSPRRPNSRGDDARPSECACLRGLFDNRIWKAAVKPRTAATPNAAQKRCRRRRSGSPAPWMAGTR